MPPTYGPDELRPRRTHDSNFVFRLEGGTEDNDLWVEVINPGGPGQRFTSTWELTDEQRKMIAAGANIDLHVWSRGHPPVAVTLGTTPLGRKPVSDDRTP